MAATAVLRRMRPGDAAPGEDGHMGGGAGGSGGWPAADTDDCPPSRGASDPSPFIALNCAPAILSIRFRRNLQDLAGGGPPWLMPLLITERSARRWSERISNPSPSALSPRRSA